MKPGSRPHIMQDVSLPGKEEPILSLLLFGFANPKGQGKQSNTHFGTFTFLREASSWWPYLSPKIAIFELGEPLFSVNLIYKGNSGVCMSVRQTGQGRLRLHFQVVIFQQRHTNFWANQMVLSVCGEGRAMKYNKIILKEKKFPKMNKPIKSKK